MSITRRFMARRADACALAVIILFFAAFFGPVLWRGQFLIAGDAYYQTYPLRTVAWAMIRQGQLPLWTPYIFSGYPLLSLAQLGLGYPLTWGYLFLPGHWAEQLIVLAPFLLAPAFTYFYARELGRSAIAALLAALSFTYGGALGGKLGGLSPMPNSLVWLPLVLLAVERARRCNFTRCLLGATCAYAMSVLAGHAQTFLLVGLLALAYAAFITLADPNGAAPEQDARGPRLWPRWRPLVVAGGGVLLTAGLAAFQILETMRVVRRSVRSSLSFETFNAGAFTPTAALNSFAAPLYHYIEVSTFVTPLAALLALFAVAQAVRRNDDRRDRRRVYFWLGTAVIAWVLMLGDSTPLYRVLYHIPVFNLFRYPSRHACEWTFAISLLAAYGWDALSAALTRNHSALAGARTRTRLIGWLLLIASATIALCWWRDTKARPRTSNFGLDSGLIPSLPEHRYLLWKLAFTVSIVLLVWRALKLTPTRTRNVLLVCAIALACYVEPRIFCAHVWFPYAKTLDRFTLVPPVERWLQQYPPEQNRIYTRVNLFVRGYWTPPPLDLPNMTAPRGLHNVAGYEQLILARYSRALGDVGPDAVNPRYSLAGAPDATLFANSSHVLDLLNASYVITFPHLATMPEAVPMNDDVPTDLDPARWQPVYHRDGIVVWQNQRAQPRAWLVAEAEAVDGEEALRRIRGASEFDPRRTALVETASSELPHLPGGELSAGSVARVVQYEPNRILIETNAPTDTLLVVSEIFYPGWVATVDQRPSQIHLTDYLLRGVALPAGQHRVELRYTAPAARNGAIISALSLLTLLGLALYSFRRRNGVTNRTGREQT